MSLGLAQRLGVLGRSASLVLGIALAVWAIPENALRAQPPAEELPPPPPEEEIEEIPFPDRPVIVIPPELRPEFPVEIPIELPPLRQQCVLTLPVLPGDGIAGTLIQPQPGTVETDTNEILPLILSGADMDQQVQVCTCLLIGEPFCSTAQLFDIVDPVNYRWTLVGEGSLAPADAPSALYTPPDLNVGETKDMEILAEIGDSRGNDLVRRFRIRITLERPELCKYRRTILIVDESDALPPGPEITPSDCTCRYQTTLAWNAEPPALDIALAPPPAVEAGKRYVLLAGGTDKDTIDLFCSGSCGADQTTLSAPDEVYYVWTARLGSFPDHTNGPNTNAWRTSVIYRAPDRPGREMIEVLGRDSGEQGVDPVIRRRMEFDVVQVDLDVDSDNTRPAVVLRPQQDPERTEAEDRIEDDLCRAGKILLVHNGDADRDVVPDFADGYDVFGQSAANASGTLTPVILEIPAPIDLDTVQVRFSYAASDPALVTATPRPTTGSRYTAAAGQLRLWGKDGPAERKKDSLDQGGDYVAPGVAYRVADFPPPIAPRTWRFWAEGIDVSGAPGDARILVEIDPDGSGPQGFAPAAEDAVRLTVDRVEMVWSESMEAHFPAFYTRSRPRLEIDPIDPGDIRFDQDNLATVPLSGSVYDRIADIVPAGAADIGKVRYEEQEIAVLRDPGEPRSKPRPHAYRGEFDGEIVAELLPGENELVLETSENVLGLRGQVVLTIEVEEGDDPSEPMRVVSVEIGEPAPEGCYRSYFARIHDILGIRDRFAIGTGSFALEADGTAGGANYVTAEPFIFLDRPASIADDHLIVVEPGQVAPWAYTNLGGAWYATAADLDVDADRDEDLDDEDDAAEDLPPGTFVPPNLDDDDGDGEVDGDNDRIDGPDDREDLVEIVLRRPPTLSDAAEAKVVLKKSGAGRIRLFLDDGGQGEVILGPDDDESRDLWPDLVSGDLTLLAEGVGKGELALDMVVYAGEGDCADRLALKVPTFKLELGVSEPFLDGFAESYSPAGYFEVPSDHVAFDDQNNLWPASLNLYALYYREDEVEDDEPPPDRTLTWEVEPGANLGSTNRELRDLIDPGLTGERIDAAPVVNLVSRVQLDFGFDFDGQRWAKAGDTFTLKVTATTPDGENLEDELTVIVVPGEKVFHVTNPPPTFDPSVQWQVPDADFASQNQDSRFVMPLSSGGKDRIRVCFFDASRNPLEEGREIALALEGSGFLGTALKLTDDEPLPEDQIEAEIGSNGCIEIEATQTTYANCPWQPGAANLETTEIFALVDDRRDVVTRSMVTRDQSLPEKLGPIELSVPSFTVTPGFLTPDRHLQETREFRVRVVRRRPTGGVVPQPNVRVAFSSLNGKLSPADGIVTTGSNGEARVTLTSEGARLEPITVIAAVGTESEVVSFDNMEWISSATTELDPERHVLAGDATANGVVVVETLQDDGESLAFPGATEGDGYLGVPYFAETRVRLRGLANHDYHIFQIDDASWAVSARYPFDVRTSANTTPDVAGGNDATVVGATVDTQIKAEGAASLRFTGNDRVQIPGVPAVDLGRSFLMTLWVWPDNLTPRELVIRDPQYRLTIAPAGAVTPPARGHVRFAVGAVDAGGQTATSEVISARPLVPRTWNFIEVRVDARGIRLAVGPDPGQLDTSFAPLPPVQAVSTGVPVVVGRGFRGRLDDLRFVQGGQAPEVVEVVGLVAGSPVETEGKITTDANGEAIFIVRSTGRWDPDRYIPIRVTIEVVGSEKAEATIWVCPKIIWGHLVNASKAFLMGTESLGRDAGWFETAAAHTSELIPFVSDLRTLGFEIYKAASGCDEVSLLNVGFAVAGLIVDVATFGTAGRAVQAGKLTLKAGIKVFFKELAQNLAIGAVTKLAFAGFAELATKEMTRADGSRETVPAEWVLASQQYLEDLTTWTQSGLADTIDSTFRSVDEIFLWLQVYRELGAGQTQAILELIEAEGQ